MIKTKKRANKTAIATGVPMRLDLGCGPHKREGFKGCDASPFPGVDYVFDLAQPIYEKLPEEFKHLEKFFERKRVGFCRWPWDDSSVDEVHSSHFIEHLSIADERIHFFNELYRILKPGAKATIITPHWASCRSYGDPTHKWAPVSEFAWYYLKNDWRAANAPHSDAQYFPGGFKCNFDVTWYYTVDGNVAARNQEYQQTAIQYYKEACQDTVATLTAIK